MNPESRAMLPKQAFTGFAARYSPPTLDEGFMDITKVDFEVRCRSIACQILLLKQQVAASKHEPAPDCIFAVSPSANVCNASGYKMHNAIRK